MPAKARKLGRISGQLAMRRRSKQNKLEVSELCTHKAGSEALSKQGSKKCFSALQGLDTLEKEYGEGTRGRECRELVIRRCLARYRAEPLSYNRWAFIV